MRLVNYKTLNTKQGNLLLAYGPSGIGKTVTTIQTSPDPIIYLTAEGRKIETSMIPVSRPDVKMLVGEYEEYNDLINTCLDFEMKNGIYQLDENNKRIHRRFKDAKTIVLDSLTHLMIVHLSMEILSENWSSKTEEQKREIEKQLTMQVKLSEEAYGTLAGQMIRLMRALQMLTVAGYDVVCLAREADRPRWNRSLSAAPALMGREFSKSMDGFFDFICRLSPPDHKDGDIKPEYGSNTQKVWSYYAPLATFDRSEDCLAKWTGAIGPKGISGRKYNVRKIFEEANGIFTHSTVNSTPQSQGEEEEDNE
jgi:hypothetical protein